MTTKQHILTLLESNRGESISGEHIAKQLNLSRNAIWKAIKELRIDGYKIEAVTNKGYCLCSDNDILSVQGMLPFLKNKDFADKIIIYDSLQSTNKTAKEMAISGAAHGMVIVANSQVSGRGRYDRQFHSPPGGVYMSIILHPEQLSFEVPALITALAAVAVCEAVETLTEKTLCIKWVNDLYLNEKKVCGILTEAVTDFESGNIQWIVVGIGVNFNTKEDDFPDDLRNVAGSILSNKNRSVTRNQFIAQIINEVLFYSVCDHEKILRKYKKRLMTLGKKIIVVSTREKYEVTAVDIDDIGRLIVKTENNEIRALSAGEIKLQS